MSVFIKQLAALPIVLVVICKECLMCARLIYLADVSEDSGLTFWAFLNAFSHRCAFLCCHHYAIAWSLHTLSKPAVASNHRNFHLSTEIVRTVTGFNLGNSKTS